MRWFFYYILLLVVIILVIPRCAIIVPPTGGLKDTIAPKMIRSIPPINSTNFNKKKIVLTFDEYFQLKEINQKLVLSPPQEQLPSFKVKGKSLELTFFEPLNENTTYTIYFSDAISDLNEGNPIPNFEFAFSTGDVIDSLKFHGRIIDAFKLEPQNGILVMLYSDIRDSVPIKDRPLYVTKTNRQGNFTLSNIKEGDYKLFALKDGNSNYLFDQVSEEIAFHPDTILSNMLYWPTDSTVSFKDNVIVLRLFAEENLAVNLTDFSRKSRRKIQLGFTRKPEGEISIMPINTSLPPPNDWFIREKNQTGDSLVFWISDDYVNFIDSLQVEMRYLKTDSLLNLVESIDTLRLFYFEKEKQTSWLRRRDSDEEEVEKTISARFSPLNNGNILPHESFKLIFDLPLREINPELISITNITDSIPVADVNFTLDTLNPRLYEVKKEWQYNARYRFTALPGAFIDLDSLRNDTLVTTFNGINPDFFGVINLNLTSVTPDVIVELLTERKALVDKKIASKDGIVKFNYVKPGKYTVRFIIDENKNGKWDTGKYLKGIQPERVIMYTEKGEPTVLNIRANWEYDISFNLNQK